METSPSPGYQRSGHFTWTDRDRSSVSVDVAWWWSFSDQEATEITVTVMGDLWLRIICLLITE